MLLLETLLAAVVGRNHRMTPNGIERDRPC